jgi:hypothetical protein
MNKDSNHEGKVLNFASIGLIREGKGDFLTPRISLLTEAFIQTNCLGLFLTRLPIAVA